MTKSEFIQRATLVMVQRGEHEKGSCRCYFDAIDEACKLADCLEDYTDFTDFDDPDVCSEHDLPPSLLGPR